MQVPRPLSWLLRASIAFALLYPAISGFITPAAWIGWFPPFVAGLAPAAILLSIWGTVEIVIAAWILSGKRIFLPSLAAAAMLALVVAFNFSLMDIVFRDVSLMLVALALAAVGYRSKEI